jgi:hypothetical protein
LSEPCFGGCDEKKITRRFCQRMRTVPICHSGTSSRSAIRTIK